MKNRLNILPLLALLALFAVAGIAHGQSKPDDKPAVQQLIPDFTAPPPAGDWLFIATCYGAKYVCEAQYPGDWLYGPGGSDYEWWVYRYIGPDEY